MMAVINDSKIVEFGPSENIWHFEVNASEHHPLLPNCHFVSAFTAGRQTVTVPGGVPVVGVGSQSVVTIESMTESVLCDPADRDGQSASPDFAISEVRIDGDG